MKIVGVVVSFLGAVCVGLQDSRSENGSMHTVSGDIVALLAAAGYGLYTTMIRRMVRFTAAAHDYHHVLYMYVCARYLTITACQCSCFWGA